MKKDLHPTNYRLVVFKDLNLHIERGDRIAQLVVQRVAHVTLVPVDELSPSERGEGGFGHSGR